MEYTGAFLAKCFAAYLFSHFRYDGSLSINRNIGGISFVWDVIDGKDGETYRTDKCKIILKPLSKITDEDKCLIIAMLIETGEYEHIYKDNSVNMEIAFKGLDLCIFWDGINKVNNYDNAPLVIIDFLRSKSYDCGFGHIPSLIAAGIAIE